MVEGKLRLLSQIAPLAIGAFLNRSVAGANNQTGITGVTAKMLGMGANLAFTPSIDGDLIVICTGKVSCDTTAKTTTTRLKHGTGTAPANGDADAGLAAGQEINFKALTGMLSEYFCTVGLITGAAKNVAQWLDFSVATDDAGATGNVEDVNIIILQVGQVP